MNPAMVPRLTAEVAGTAMLVFFGVGGLITSGQAFIGAIAFLAAAAVSVWIFGGHFNPWITLAVAIKGSVGWLRAGLIILAQLVGGIIGALLLWAVLGGEGAARGLGATHLPQEAIDGGNSALIRVILAEAIAVFLLCCAVFAAGDGINGGISMGLAYAAGIMAISVVSAASLNFARSLGPETVLLFAADTPDWAGFGRLWVYAVSGILGAALAGLLYPVWRPAARGPVTG
ncbi:MAG TPA: aquaporin [Candidatus Limnocylindrales bacterium]